MKKSLDHLPVHKQEELRAIAHIITDTLPSYMVILFGSYARGDWVEDQYTDGHITYAYQSDYDILVIPRDSKNANKFSTLDKVESRVRESNVSKTWVNIIIHDIDFLQKKIEHQEYFFADIKREGIMLYDSGEQTLPKLKKISPLIRKQMAEEDFQYWSGIATDFYKQYENGMVSHLYRNAAFQLHQVTEALFTTILLVYTHYKPKLHDLLKLSQQAAAVDPAFFNIIPRTTPEEKRLFQLLQKAYIEARYKKEYTISKEELEYLGGKVKNLESITQQKCKEKIASFCE